MGRSNGFPRDCYEDRAQGVKYVGCSARAVQGAIIKIAGGSETGSASEAAVGEENISVYAPAPGSAPAIKASGVKLKGKGEGGRAPEEERKTGSKGGRRCQ